MAKKKGKKGTKPSIVNAICALIAVAGLVAVIIGVFGDFFKCTAKLNVVIFEGTDVQFYKLSALADSDLEMYDLVNAFAYVVFGLAICAATFSLVSVLLNNKPCKKIAPLVGAVLLIAAILLAVFAFVFCSKNSTETTLFGVTGKYTFSVYTGALLTMIGGAVAGLATIGAGAKR